MLVFAFDDRRADVDLALMSFDRFMSVLLLTSLVVFLTGVFVDFAGGFFSSAVGAGLVTGGVFSTGVVEITSEPALLVLSPVMSCTISSGTLLSDDVTMSGGLLALPVSTDGSGSSCGGKLLAGGCCCSSTGVDDSGESSVGGGCCSKVAVVDR